MKVGFRSIQERDERVDETCASIEHSSFSPVCRVVFCNVILPNSYPGFRPKRLKNVERWSIGCMRALLWYAMTALKCVLTRVCALKMLGGGMHTLLWYAMMPKYVFSLGSCGMRKYCGIHSHTGMQSTMLAWYTLVF